MSSFTATPTTSYVMIDGVDVPATVGRTGTNPTALIQAGNLNIGARNGALFFPGKIAQVGIYSAKVTESTIAGTLGQTLAGTETSMISAYTLSNSLTDLNANANNLTANGSALTTNADTPFAEGLAAGSLEYGIITDISFSTNTTVVVQCGIGGVMPTSGGLTTLSYSANAMPLGFPPGLTDNRVLADTKIPAGGTAGSTANSGVASTVVTIPPGRSIKVIGTAVWGDFNTSQNSTSVLGVVMDGVITIAAGTSWLNGSAAASNSTQPTAIGTFTPVAGSHTFTLSFSLGGGFQMSGYTNAEIIIELEN
jgi:hypothetical protein